jgi:hypothetical protein
MTINSNASVTDEDRMRLNLTRIMPNTIDFPVQSPNYRDNIYAIEKLL